MADAISSLISSSQTRPSRLTDLLSERPNDVTLGVFSGYTTKTPTGAPTQKTALQNLKDYVGDNVTGNAAKSLMAQIAAVENLFSLNDPTAQQDAVYALLAGNADTLRTMPAGSLVSGLF